jgi:hypothetical protein
LLIEKVAVVVGTKGAKVLVVGLVALFWNVMTWLVIVEPLVVGPEPLANSRVGWAIAEIEIKIPKRRIEVLAAAFFICTGFD